MHKAISVYETANGDLLIDAMPEHEKCKVRTYRFTADGHVWAIHAPMRIVDALRKAGYSVRC